MVLMSSAGGAVRGAGYTAVITAITVSVDPASNETSGVRRRQKWKMEVCLLVIAP